VHLNGVPCRLMTAGGETFYVIMRLHIRLLFFTKCTGHDLCVCVCVCVLQVLVLFKDFVKVNRPEVDIEQVATGETWCVYTLHGYICSVRVLACSLCFGHMHVFHTSCSELLALTFFSSSYEYVQKCIISIEVYMQPNRHAHVKVHTDDDNKWQVRS
jgi:hypothetical protein